MIRSYTYDEFKVVLMEYIRLNFEDKAGIRIHKVIKNNSLELDSLVIMEDGKNISPNFYLNAYYNEYLSGIEISMLADKIVESYYKADIAGIENLDMNFEECKDKIVCRLVSRDRNRKLLENIPYIPFLDMIITFYYLAMEDEDGIGSIRISNNLTDIWNISTQELYRLAIKNTIELFPRIFCPLPCMIEAVMLNKKVSEIPDYILNVDFMIEKDMPYILTNRSGINGAVAMIYPECLKEIGGELGVDFYILPSSIHEIIIVPDCGCIKSSELEAMVHEVNENCVTMEEVLSENIYYYSVENNTVEVCKNMSKSY